MQTNMSIKRLYQVTPFMESGEIGKLVGTKVYLKMENSHAVGSFKFRGISHLCQKAKNDGFKKIIGSSGGSAGLAMAYTAQLVGIQAHIIVPKTTGIQVKNRIAAFGAAVDVHGDNWTGANELALELVSKDPESFYAHPFDDPIVWSGHATMIEEIAERMNEIPSAVVLSVGGGGLACGVIMGMQKIGWGQVPVLAMETVGADCFNQALKAGKKVVLPAITSVAICLGATVVCQKLLDFSKERVVLSKVVEDREAVNGCLKFADDHRVLTDPACGATLAAAYSGLLKQMREDGTISDKGPIVMIVCGGNDVTLEKLSNWKKDFGL